MLIERSSGFTRREREGIMGYSSIYEQVKLSGTKVVKCAGGCGRRLKRNTTVCQTVNPYNVARDGKPKGHGQICAELADTLRKWKLKQEYCIHCEPPR